MSPRQRARRKGQGVGRRARRLACSVASWRVWQPATEREVSPGYAPFAELDTTTYNRLIDAIAADSQFPRWVLRGEQRPINTVTLTSSSDVRYSIRPPVIKDETFTPRAAIIMRMSDPAPPPAPDTTTFSIGRPNTNDIEPI